MTQSIDYLAIAAPLTIALVALVVLVADAFLPAGRRVVTGWVAAAGLAGAGLLLLPLVGQRHETFCVPGGGLVLPSCSYVVTEVTLVFQALVVAGALVCVLLSLDTVRDSALPAGEYFFLLLASVSGALTLAASRDVLTLVVALEVVSLPAFALVALRRYDSRSSEAALKLFLVSVVSTAVMLFGLSLVYGVTGAVHLDRVATALEDPVRPPVLALGVTLALAGFGFKVAAVPFHFWAPDAYEGAPVPVAAYLSVVSKAAGFAGLALLLTEGFAPYADTWAPAVAVVAAVTMTVGNLAALRQTRAVRLLAWSSVAQSGYMLVPLGSAGGDGAVADVLPATVAYVLAYGVMNLGAFSVVTLVGRHRAANALADYRGLARTEPLSAFALAFSLACLAGLPPGLLGLFAKVVVFRAPVDQGVGWLAVVMAVNVVVGLVYYLAWAASLYVGRGAAQVTGSPADPGRPPSYRISWSDGVAIGATLGAALTLSVVPDTILRVG